MDDLEARLGKGRVVIGGHPNSGRVWRTKACDIGADGFDRDVRGSLLTDGFAITKWKGNAANQYPFTLLPGLRTRGELLPDATISQFEAVLASTWKRITMPEPTDSTERSSRFVYRTKQVELTLTASFSKSGLSELILWIGR